MCAEDNDVPVLGIREVAWLRRRGDELRVGGEMGARLFLRGQEPVECADSTDLAFLLSKQPRFDPVWTRRPISSCGCVSAR